MRAKQFDAAGELGMIAATAEENYDEDFR